MMKVTVKGTVTVKVGRGLVTENIDKKLRRVSKYIQILINLGHAKNLISYATDLYFKNYQFFKFWKPKGIDSHSQ